MIPQHACPTCRTALPHGVANCPQCGTSLDGLREIPAAEVKSLTKAVSGATAEVATAMTPTDSQMVQTILGAYQVAQRYPLQTCTFYHVTDRESGDSYLVRETQRPRALSARLRERLQAAGQEVPHLIPHREILSNDSHSYAVIQHPGSGWRTLSLVPAPLETSAAVEWVRQAAAALTVLAGQGFAHYPPGQAGREGFIVDHNNRLYLADLTLFQPLPEGHSASSRPLVSLLYYLTTGQELPPYKRELTGVPEVLHPLLQPEGDQLPLDAFVELLGKLELPAPAPRRALRQLAGSTTDTGRQRGSNEDWVGTLSYTLDRTGHTIPLGLYIVADGMGGYAAGEHASSSGIRHSFIEFIREEVLPDLENITRRLSPELTPEGKLEAIVQLANQRVYENRRRSGGERGSTITAAMIAGSNCVVANVGDSRAYLYRERELSQITEDHSLVMRLVKAGEIEADEIYTHPQRNQIYRSLGDRVETPIDTFSLQLRAGDRLLLCSDGLWEMVRDPEIAQILGKSTNAQLACDQLIVNANRNGGEDNISAIVVDMQ